MIGYITTMNVVTKTLCLILDTLSIQCRNLKFCSYFEFSFSFLFHALLSLRFQLSCGKSVKYRLIESFVL